MKITCLIALMLTAAAAQAKLMPVKAVEEICKDKIRRAKKLPDVMYCRQWPAECAADDASDLAACVASEKAKQKAALTADKKRGKAAAR